MIDIEPSMSRDMIDRLRALVADHAGLAVDMAGLAQDADLYRAGMSSFASVQLMLALEEAFDIEFPEAMLSPRTFSSLDAIQAAVTQLASARA
jgi:acyl carrier protein